jgi:hypothetical protein
MGISAATVATATGVLDARDRLTFFFLLHLMPLPPYRNNLAACDASLAKLSPCVLEKDSSDWKKRMPKASVR